MFISKINCILVTIAFTGIFFFSTAMADLPHQADITVSDVALDDAAGAKAPFAAPPQLDDPDSDRPKAYFCNEDRSEKLTLVYYEGDTAYIVSEFRVERVETRYVDCAQPAQPIARFVTGKGIRLGMTQSEVTRILGRGYNTHPQLDEIVISYRIDDKHESDFLQRHGAPAYYGQYHFVEDRLVRFDFGFEFP